MVLIGNKSDLTQNRQIDSATGRRFALDHNMLFVETSAKEFTNIERAFEMVCDKLIANAEELSLNMLDNSGESSLTMARLTQQGKNTLGGLQDRLAAFDTNQRNSRVSKSCCGGMSTPAKISDDY
eukprot:c3357_g1_i1.p1 GENE.c3357_g1_i1~~c3357_g1_i1.p1  ORF type:complete len:125 (+),score=43.84 c3357_g1_i1:160-534(+)